MPGSGPIQSWCQAVHVLSLPSYLSVRRPTLEDINALQYGNVGLCTPETSVLCAWLCFLVCLAMMWLLTIGRKSHSWHWVHTGLSDVLEVHRDVPEKKRKGIESTVSILEEGLDQRTTWTPLKLEELKSCSLVQLLIPVQKCWLMMRKQLWWRNHPVPPLQLQYVNNSVQSERNFWCLSADRRVHPHQIFYALLCLSTLGVMWILATWS